MRDGCVFCDYEGPSGIVKRGMVVFYDPAGAPRDYHYFVIEPIAPVTPGHLLVIPRDHEPDFRLDTWLLAATMEAAAQVAADVAANEVVGDPSRPVPGCNLIVSAGAAATQTVGHLHVHVVPRHEGDGLLLPWDRARVSELEDALRPFAEQARHLREWRGGPPMPAHAFREEIFAAEEAMSVIREAKLTPTLDWRMHADGREEVIRYDEGGRPIGEAS